MEPLGLPDGQYNIKLRPHHVWRAVLIHILCQESSDKVKTESPEAVRIVAKIDSYLLDTPEDDDEDVPLGDVLSALDKIDPSGKWTKKMSRRCCGLARDLTDVYPLHCLVQDLTDLFNPVTSGQSALLHAFSFNGLYINDFITSFNYLTFEETCDLHARCCYHSELCHHPEHIDRACGDPRQRLPSSDIRDRRSHVLHGTSPILVHAEESQASLSSISATPITTKAISASTPLDHNTLSSTPAGIATPQTASTAGHDSSARMAAFTEGGLFTPPGVGVPCTPANGSERYTSRYESLADITSDDAKGDICFELPPLSFSRPPSTVFATDPKPAQELSDKLFMSLNQRDWPSLVACHHELYNRTMPRHRQPSDKEDSAEAKRKSVCHALRHIGSATKELANAAASLGYDGEVEILRNKAIQVALLAGHTDALHWAQSDVHAALQPSSHEANVFSQVLFKATDKNEKASPFCHLSHLWTAWNDLSAGNIPVAQIGNELTACQARIHDQSLHHALPQVLDFMSSVYQTYGYTCCSQLYAQMLFSVRYKSPAASITLEARVKSRAEDLQRVCQATLHLVNCAMNYGDYRFSNSLLEYVQKLDADQPWSVSIKEVLATTECTLRIEENFLRCRWSAVRHWVQSLSGHSWNLASYYDAKLFLELGETHRARIKTEQLISILEKDFSLPQRYFGDHLPTLLAKSLLLLSEVLVASGCEESHATSIFDKAERLCKSYHLVGCHQHVIFTKAQWQLSRKSISDASKNLCPWLPLILAHGECLLKGKALLLYARLLVNDQPESAPIPDLKRATKVMTDSETILLNCEAKKTLVSLYHWKCRLHRALDEQALCVKAARSFSQLSQEIPR